MAVKAEIRKVQPHLILKARPEDIGAVLFGVGTQRRFNMIPEHKIGSRLTDPNSGVDIIRLSGSTYRVVGYEESGESGLPADLSEFVDYIESHLLYDEYTIETEH